MTSAPKSVGAWSADNEFELRALAAYFRAKRRSGGDPDMPSSDSEPVKNNGMEYFVLRNVRGVLAVYRIRNHTGSLKRLKRWSTGPLLVAGGLATTTAVGVAALLLQK